MSHEIHGSSRANPQPTDSAGGSLSSSQVRDFQIEALRLVATLQVKINVLRRAKEIAPELSDELQVEIDAIDGTCAQKNRTRPATNLRGGGRTEAEADENGPTGGIVGPKFHSAAGTRRKRSDGLQYT